MASAIGVPGAARQNPNIDPYFEPGHPRWHRRFSVPLPGNKLVGGLLILDIVDKVFDRIRALRAEAGGVGPIPGFDRGWCAVINPPRNRWRHPRGMAWTDLPVLLPARTQLHPDTAMITRLDDFMHAGTAPVEHAVEAPGAVLVAMGSLRGLNGYERLLRLMHLAACIDLIEAFGLGDRELYLDDDLVRPVTLRDLREIAAGAEPWRRYLYNWSFNFAAIGAKALGLALEAATVADIDARDAILRWGRFRPAEEADLPDVRIETTRMAGSIGPLDLQVLYRLRRAGPVDVSGCLGPYGGQCGSLLGHFFRSGPHGLEWEGTGKHPPLVFDGFTCRAIGDRLVETLLVRVDGGILAVSAIGERFLDTLHPDCEDPDLPCRWAHRPLTAEDGAALDASLIRTFRKMKTRVNAL